MTSSERHWPDFYEVPAGVVITPRIAFLLHKRTNIAAVRVKALGSDSELYNVALLLHRYAMSYEKGSEVPSIGSAVSQSPEPEQELDTERAADRLGVSTRSISKAIGTGKLPAVKVKGRWIIQRSDLDRYATDRWKKARGR